MSKSRLDEIHFVHNQLVPTRVHNGGVQFQEKKMTIEFGEVEATTP